MEKLIELLNERMEEEEKLGPKHSRFLNYDGINHVFRLNNGCSFCMEFVLSKRYGFIEWLVENDKIDRGDDILGIEWNILDNYGYENGLLILLSISSSPVEDLISFLM